MTDMENLHNHDQNIHDHDHGHHHDFHHDHHGLHHHHHGDIILREDGRLASVFYWAIGLNLGYVILEGIFGFSTGSMGLLSDAGHNLSDVASLLIALIAFKASQRPPTPSFSYGYGRSTIEASLINAVILYVAVILIAIESIGRLIHPAPVDGEEIAWIAAAGVVVNGVTAWMLLSHSHHDLNVKGAFMHMAADTLVSLGVVVSGIVISFTGWTWLDPVVGLCIAVMIAFATWSLLKKSLKLSLDAVPDDVDIDEIEKAILSVNKVKSLHHLHVWGISTTRKSLTVHVIVDTPADIDMVITDVRDILMRMGIDHSTIEAETSLHACGSSGLDKLSV